VASKWTAIDVSLPLYHDEIQMVVSPGATDQSSTGPYRNLEPADSTEYPIHLYNIQGVSNFATSEKEYVVFINGDAITEGFTAKGDQILFDSPLSVDDHVTVRIMPKNGLLLAEIETNQNKIIRIDNTVRETVFEKSGDRFIEKAIQSHVHDGVSAEKILLTTETSLIDSESVSEDRKTFVYSKDLESYGFDFSAGTYIAEVYINGLLTSDAYTVIDDDSNKKISIVFGSSLSISSIVKLKLSVRGDFTQIKIN